MALRMFVLLFTLALCGQALAFSDLRVERRQAQEIKNFRQIQGDKGQRYSVDGRGAVYTQDENGKWVQTQVKRQSVRQSDSAYRSPTGKINHLPAQLYHQNSPVRR